MIKNRENQVNRNSTFNNIFTNKNVLVAIGSTLFLLIIFQFGANITAPGIKLPQNQEAHPLFNILNLLGGGGLKRSSLFAVGISPYITSQIIIQMLASDVLKPLANLKKAGERGRKKIELYTRILTLPFAVATSYGTLVLISNTNLGNFIVNNKIVNSISDVPSGQQFLMIMMFVAGTYISLFIADIISKKGVGNGTTLVIMSGIIAAIPNNFYGAWETFLFIASFTKEAPKFIAIASFVIYFLFYLLVILLVVFINGSVRKIPIQQTGQSLVTEQKRLPFFPIKLIPAGVLPVVFAGSIISIPEIIGSMINTNSNGYRFIKNYLSINSRSGLIIYASLIFMFSFFYAHIQVNAEKLTEGFEKSNRFIPGVNIGQATYDYIRKIIQRINWIGTPLLTIVAILPNLLSIFNPLLKGSTIGGIGIIIAVSGSIQLWESIKSTAISVKYVTQKQELQEQIQLTYESLVNQQLAKVPTKKANKSSSELWSLW